jgi:hypothetical protein
MQTMGANKASPQLFAIVHFQPLAYALLRIGFHLFAHPKILHLSDAILSHSYLKRQEPGFC